MAGVGRGDLQPLVPAQRAKPCLPYMTPKRVFQPLSFLCVQPRAVEQRALAGAPCAWRGCGREQGPGVHGGLGPLLPSQLESENHPFHWEVAKLTTLGPGPSELTCEGVPSLSCVSCALFRTLALLSDSKSELTRSRPTIGRPGIQHPHHLWESFGACLSLRPQRLGTHAGNFSRHSSVLRALWQLPSSFRKMRGMFF